tara:strand:- start:222 stop:500 length:279 start_codon:yes stop_codon:yes gene_type:complete
LKSQSLTEFSAATPRRFFCALKQRVPKRCQKPKGVRLFLARLLFVPLTGSGTSTTLIPSKAEASVSQFTSRITPSVGVVSAENTGGELIVTL